MLTQIINGHILTPQGWMKDGSTILPYRVGSRNRG